MSDETLEGERFRVVEPFSTALDSAPMNEGEVFKVTEDPFPYEMPIEDECIEVIHEPMIGMKDRVYVVVLRSEFVEKTEEV